MLGEFTGEGELDGSLDFAGRQSVSLVVSDEAGSFVGESVEGVRDEGVHDSHGLSGDTSFGVDLLQHLVDVDGIGFLSLLLLFLVAGSTGGLSLTRLLGALGRNFGRHGDEI